MKARLLVALAVAVVMVGLQPRTARAQAAQTPAPVSPPARATPTTPGPQTDPIAQPTPSGLAGGGPTYVPGLTLNALPQLALPMNGPGMLSYGGGGSFFVQKQKSAQERKPTASRQGATGQNPYKGENRGVGGLGRGNLGGIGNRGLGGGVGAGGMGRGVPNRASMMNNVRGGLGVMQGLRGLGQRGRF